MTHVPRPPQGQDASPVPTRYELRPPAEERAQELPRGRQQLLRAPLLQAVPPARRKGNEGTHVGARWGSPCLVPRSDLRLIKLKEVENKKE